MHQIGKARPERSHPIRSRKIVVPVREILQFVGPFQPIDLAWGTGGNQTLRRHLAPKIAGGSGRVVCNTIGRHGAGNVNPENHRPARTSALIAGDLGIDSNIWCYPLRNPRTRIENGSRTGIVRNCEYVRAQLAG